MGCFDTYCCFCAGPLEDARRGWLNQLTGDCSEESWPPRDGEWINAPGFPVPTKPIEEIVTISPEDGALWDDWVCVAPVWDPGYVSPPCSVDSYGAVEIEGREDWNRDDVPFLHIHRCCLSWLCRRNNLTPKALWESFYAPDSDYRKYGESGQGLKYCVEYYDMQGRAVQFFGFAVERYEPPKSNPDAEPQMWWDPDSMDDTAWILARPTVLPVPSQLETRPLQHATLPSECRIFAIDELFDMILDNIVHVPASQIREELFASGAFDAASVRTAAKTLLALSEVNKWFYRAVVQKRQNIFFKAIQNFEWMLPCTSQDVLHSKWPESMEDGKVSQPRDSKGTLDWRAYMLTCLRKDTPHIRNRWRFHRMALQFARGKKKQSTSEIDKWHWNAGELAVTTQWDHAANYEWEIHVNSGN